jgi:hypothetical protein
MDADGDPWLREVDHMADSDAPDRIALDLGRRHGLYLREAQRLVAEGLAPDQPGLADGIRADTARYLRSHPWAAHPTLGPAVAAADARSLAALQAIVASAPPAAAPPPPAQPRPVRRLALQPSATIVGNMAVRKRPAKEGLELSWDPAPNVTEWTVRISLRPDPRSDYVEGDVVSLPAGASTYEVALDETPRRIQLYGHARDGRIVRRAVISALTSGNSGSQWKRQATAS